MIWKRPEAPRTELYANGSYRLSQYATRRSVSGSTLYFAAAARMIAAISSGGGGAGLGPHRDGGAAIDDGDRETPVEDDPEARDERAVQRHGQAIAGADVDPGRTEEAPDGLPGDGVGRQGDPVDDEGDGGQLVD